MRRTIQAVCFDLDDTLYDYRGYARTGLEAAGDHLEARTGHRLHAELFELYFSDGVTEGTFDVIVDRHGLDPDLVGDLVSAFHDAVSPLEPYPETELTLERLRSTRDLGVITDGRNGREKLHRLGLTDYFQAVLVTPEIGRSKHDRAVFERVLDDLDVEPTEAVYVGDDPRIDFRIPNALGMTTIRLRRGRYSHLAPVDEVATPAHELDRLDGLLSLIAERDGPDRAHPIDRV